MHTMRESQQSTWAAAIMVFFGILFISLHRLIPQMYTEEQAVIPIAGRLIIILSLFQIFDAVQMASRSSLLGLKDINTPLIFSAVSYYGVCLPSAYVLGFTLGLGPEGVWTGLLLGLATAAVLFNIRSGFVCPQIYCPTESGFRLQGKLPPGTSVPFGRIDQRRLPHAIKFRGHFPHTGRD